MSGVFGKPDPDQNARAAAAKEHRDHATGLAPERGTARTRTNGEELAYGDTFAASFHKALPHDANGFVAPSAYRAYVEAVSSQDHRAFENLPVGDNFPQDRYPRYTQGDEDRRKMTSPFTGHVYDLEGADAGALSVDAAPTLASDELAAELAEVYVMALLRDTSFETIEQGNDANVRDLQTALAGMPWFAGGGGPAGGSRRRPLKNPRDLFRGSTEGSRRGPWMSQFLLVGNRFPGRVDCDGKAPDGKKKGKGDRPPCFDASVGVRDGYVFYGTQVIDQRSIVAEPGVDWLQTWASWLDAQNGVDFNGKDCFRPERMFLSTPRDIATYVHFDALYQAYHVAANLMLAGGAPFGFDRGMPETTSRTRSAFASFGGPHVLSLVAEVATRALKLVWRQKWLHHRRLRPEVAAALVTLVANDEARVPDGDLRDALRRLAANIPTEILDRVAQMNAKPHPCGTIPPITGCDKHLPEIKKDKNFLLPMAFPEGSPTHPAYGAGHATVAGSCVTVLKAFFEMYDWDGTKSTMEEAEKKGKKDTKRDPREHAPWPPELPWPLMKGQAPTGPSARYGFDKNWAGAHACLTESKNQEPLTLQGELDKLAANISTARNMAGVHYYTDYFASVRQGERLTASILEEQLALFNEPVTMSFTSFDGDRLRVRGSRGASTVSVVDRGGHAVSSEDWYQRYG